MYGTGSDHHYRDSSADHIVQRRTARRVMFTDECSCDLWEEEIRRRRYSSSHVADCWSDHAHNSNNAASSCDCENAGRLEDPSSGHHYQTPKEVDGDYSYAYSDSVSPAFLIRINASLQAGNNANSGTNMCGGGQPYNEEAENIYEEINEAVAMRRPPSAERNGTASGDSIRSLFQKAKESVRRTSKIMDESKDETDSTFHMSISKGRKKTLIDRAHIDWDDDLTLKETLSVKGSTSTSSTKSSTENGSKASDGKNHPDSSNSERENSVDTRETVTSTSPSGEDTQDDSGFHSGGIEEPNRRKKSKSQRNGKSRSESSDRLKSNISNNNNKYQQQSNNNQDLYSNKNGANSIKDGGQPPHMRENGGKSKESADQRSEARRSRVIDMMQQQPHSLPHMYPPHIPPHHLHHPHMMAHPPPSLPLPPPPPPPNHPQAQRKKSVLSRLVSPFLKGSHTSNNGPSPPTQVGGIPPPLQPQPQLYASPQQYLPPHHPHHIAVVPHYGPNNNIDKYHEEKGGRTFYL